MARAACILLCLCLARPLTAGLVGYWPFDGDAADDSGAANHGELIGGTYVNSVPPVLATGQALNLEVATDHVYVPAHASLNSNVFTLSMFVNDQGQFSAGFNRFTSRAADTFETAIDKAFGTESISYYSPFAGWVTTNAVPELDEWNHVAYVADGTTMTVYVNGQDVLGPMAFVASPSGYMHIGNRWNNTEGFFGLMDDVALWDVALPASSIMDLATGAKRPPQIPVPEPPPPPPEPFLSVVSDVETWQLSEVSIDGGELGEWDPSGDPLPPGNTTFTLDSLPTEATVVPHINGAASILDVQGIQAENDTHYYRTTFQLDRTSGFSTEIRLAVDNGAQLYINGQRIATEVSFVVENWGVPLPSISIDTDGTIEFTKFDEALTSFSGWKVGENEVVLAVRNPFSEVSPAGGFAFRMDFFDPNAGTAGDFNDDGVLGVADIDLLTAQAASEQYDAAYDLNNDALVNTQDVEIWAHELANIWIGDTDVNGEFNSADFVSVFVLGKYESSEPAVWSAGDWNGDGWFNSSDFVAAFVDGGYEQGPRAAPAAAVPEPAAALLLLMSCGGLACWRRR